LTAKEIWEIDIKKRNCLYDNRNIKTIVVWESENKTIAINKIMEIINEFKTDKN